MSHGCLGPQPFPEPMAPVSGLVGPAGPFALSSCLCATTLVFTGGPRTFCPAVSFSVTLQGLASSECHSQGEQSNRLDVGGSQTYLESPNILCNCTLSRVPSLPDPISPWWPPVLFMEGRQSPRKLLALPLHTYLQNAPLPKSPGLWGSMCRTDRGPRDLVSHPLHYSSFEGLTVAHTCKPLGSGCGVLFCVWPKGNMTQLLPFAQPAAFVLHICLIYIIIC